jgi:hypothetical protein
LLRRRREADGGRRETRCCDIIRALAADIVEYELRLLAVYRDTATDQPPQAAGVISDTGKVPISLRG